MAINTCNAVHRARGAYHLVIRMVMSFFCGAIVPAVLQASATTQPAPPDHPIKQVSDAYCGIRCLYAAAIAQGVRIPASDLVRPEYIGSREGSSIDELALAANTHGLHAFPFTNGSVQSLLGALQPAIVHVESVPGSGRYDHFVLYLGQRENKLIILDPAIAAGQPAQLMEPRDLELMWDGAGVIVSKAPITPYLFESQIKPIAMCGGVLMCIVGSVRLPTVRKRVTSLGTAGEVLAIAALALLAPAVSALCAQSGLLAHPQQVGRVEQTHVAYFLPRVSIPTAAQRSSAGSAVFVDARYAADYGAGHLPGAINVPVTASRESVRLYMQNVRQNVPVIVYCQSKSCPFAKAVATSLLQEGFTSVQLLDGGWEEWCQWKH
jgi:rhodanese-related sulfurtransferase